jgi:phosphate starvation-inducible PhoH-like protein
MRGRTLSDAFVILDEAQNATREQLKMFLTRWVPNSKMVVNGDVTQIDLPRGVAAGCSTRRAVRRHRRHRDRRADETDVVRHPLVAKIVAAYARPT